MKFYRKLNFHKRWIDTGNDLYKIVSDAGITSFVLDKTNYYGLKLISDEAIEKGLDKLHKKYTRENLKEKEYNLNVFYPCK